MQVKIGHKIANRSFENVSQFRYFGNYSNKSKFDSMIEGEIKR
jgi:hypothetical protein